MKIFSTSKSISGFAALIPGAALVAIILLAAACNKGDCAHKRHADVPKTEAATKPASSHPSQTLSQVVTVAGIKANTDGTTDVLFNENEEAFTISDAGILSVLKDALSNSKAVKIAYNPWQATILEVATPDAADETALRAREVVSNSGSAYKINAATMSPDQFDNPDAMGVINTTTTGLTNVIPDIATAQQMFDYIAHQCCALPSPYAVDHCITFQYCQDGCYARAHKMCWILNNKYHYGTKKVFSFANAGNDKLCVQGQKWGGCCIRWWYHVAPLVTINTPTGPKAYVFDPAMFDQPVLLSAWLHAQENPACVPTGYVAHVSMINIQPTSAYTPSGTSGALFNTDPMYTSTNNTLVNYRYLTTCP